MMAPTGRWEDIFDEVEGERFVGRVHELDLFQKEIERSGPRSLLFYISGQGGVGKTTLLNRCRDLAHDAGFLLADSDESQRDVPSVLGHFAHQLAEQKFPLKQFDERYKVYCQRIGEIEGDPEAPQGLAALLGRALVRTAFVTGDLVPGIRKAISYLPEADIEAQAGAWTAYLAKKFTNKDDLALVREPIPILTKLFFQDLNAVAETKHILLCFENFEESRQHLQDWLLRLREWNPSQHIRLAMAGRDEPGVAWGMLHRVTLSIRLDVFTPQEAEQFLDRYKIKEIQRRRQILECSGRLPVLMEYLAMPDGKVSDPSVPTGDTVDLFLRWVNDPCLRRWALLAAIPYTFNLDLLRMLREQQLVSMQVDEQEAFEWLRTMPFVQQRDDGWQYHAVVRSMMLRYQRQRSPQDYQQVHTEMANFHSMKWREPGPFAEEYWELRQWRRDMLAYIYHLLAADAIKHWAEVLSLFAIAIRIQRAFAVEVIERLNQDDARAEMDEVQRSTIQLFHQQLQAIEKGNLHDGFAMFDRLCQTPGLSDQAKGCALVYRGQCYWRERRADKAFQDFTQALQCVPDDGQAFVLQGLILLEVGRYEEVLTGSNFHLTPDQRKDTSAILMLRGAAYLHMHRHEEALEEFSNFLEHYEQNTGVLTLLGATYLEMKCDKEALADFNRALAADERNIQALIYRGRTYARIGHNEEALVDLSRVIDLGQTDDSMLAFRAAIYYQMHQFKEALADLNQIHEKDRHILIYQGVVLCCLGRYEEAVAILDQALNLEGRHDLAFEYRGAAYLQMGLNEEALADLNRAIELYKEDGQRFRYRGIVYYNMDCYEEALADLNRALALDELDREALKMRGAVSYQMGCYEEALADLNRALEPDEQDAWALSHRGAVQFYLEQHKEALTDLNRALALNDASSWAWEYRSRVHLHLKCYEEALADINHALVLDEQSDWYYYRRAQVYRSLGKMEAYESDLRAAIGLAEKALLQDTDNWTLRFDLAFYHLIQEDEDSESQYYLLISQRSSLTYIQVTLGNIIDFLEIEPEHEIMQRMRLSLEARIAEFEASSDAEPSSDDLA